MFGFAHARNVTERPHLRRGVPLAKAGPTGRDNPVDVAEGAPVLNRRLDFRQFIGDDYEVEDGALALEQHLPDRRPRLVLPGIH